MAFMRSRYLWIGALLFLALDPGAAMAGCHTDCSFTFPTNPYPCLTYSFTAFSNSLCYRSSCDACDALDCTVSMPSQGDLWASSSAGPTGCPAPGFPVSTLRVVRVERLPSRG